MEDDLLGGDSKRTVEEIILTTIKNSSELEGRAGGRIPERKGQQGR